MTREEAWTELGLDGTATEHAVRTAYLALLRKRKPDHDPDGFRRLREAYETLRAPGARRDAGPDSPPVARPDSSHALEVGSAEPDPLERIRALEAALAMKPEDYGLIAQLVRELASADLRSGAATVAFSALAGPQARVVEAAPTWLVALELFPDNFDDALLWQASHVDDLMVQLAIGETQVRHALMQRALDTMTRLMARETTQLLPLMPRVVEVMLVLVAFDSKRAAPLVARILAMSEPENAALLREVSALAGQSWLPPLVQRALDERLRVGGVVAPKPWLPADLATRAPLLWARIERGLDAEPLVVVRGRTDNRIPKIIFAVPLVIAALNVAFPLVRWALTKLGLITE